MSSNTHPDRLSLRGKKVEPRATTDPHLRRLQVAPRGGLRLGHGGLRPAVKIPAPLLRAASRLVPQRAREPTRLISTPRFLAGLRVSGRRSPWPEAGGRQPLPRSGGRPTRSSPSSGPEPGKPCPPSRRPSPSRRRGEPRARARLKRRRRDPKRSGSRCSRSQISILVL